MLRSSFRSPAPARSPVSLGPRVSLGRCVWSGPPHCPGSHSRRRLAPRGRGLRVPRAGLGLRKAAGDAGRPARPHATRWHKAQVSSAPASDFSVCTPRAPPPVPGEQRCARADRSRGEGLQEEPGGGCGLRFWLSSLSLLRSGLPPPPFRSGWEGERKETVTVGARCRGNPESESASRA